MDLQDNKLTGNKFSISCKIYNYESCQESFIPFFKFIEYKIFLKTNKKNWEIKKRFKDFDELHKKLSKSIKNLPKLPPKTIFKSEEIINDRKIKLQKYLTNLLRRDDVYQHDLIFEFINLKKEDYLLMKDNLDESNSIENSPIYDRKNRNTLIAFKSFFELKNREDTVINDNFYYSFLNYKEDQVQEKIINETKKIVNDFLIDLNLKKNHNKSLIIEKFKQEILYKNVKRKNINFRNEDIYKILFGDKATKKHGLIYHCGDIKGNLLGAESCIEFLSNLIDYEHNLDSENFINILKLGKLEIFQQMNLDKHLTSGKPNLFSNCCLILKAILSEDKFVTFENLLQDEGLIEKVHNYILLYENI